MTRFTMLQEERVLDGMAQVCDAAFKNSDAHGFWDEQKNASTGDRDHSYLVPPLVRKAIPEKIALMHSELSEMLEEVREPGRDLLEIRESEKGKPEGFPIECADLVIRLADLCGAMGIDLGAAIVKKHEYNVTRPHKHGKTI